MYTYKHPRPAVAVDIAIFMPEDSGYQILLIQRAGKPFQGLYALPGGFMEIGESLEQAAQRELREETSLNNIPLTQIHTFSDPERDPRGRVISTCFAGLILDADQHTPRAASDASGLDWYNIERLPPLAFDHALIIQKVRELFLSLK